MDWLLRDLLFSCRTLWKDRASLFLALLALALGIGSTTAMFSVIDNVLLNPWPYADGNRLSMVEVRDSTANERYGNSRFSQPEVAELQKDSHVFRDFLALNRDQVIWLHGSTPESLISVLVTGNTFQALGVSPAMGRFLLPADAKPGAPPVFVMSYKMWQAKFSGRRDLLGKTFAFNDKRTTLVGIMPSRFVWFGGDIWQPRDVNPAETADSATWFLPIGHLKPGVTLKSAQPEIALIIRRLAKAYPKDFPKRFDVRVVSFTDAIVGRFQRTLYLLLGAVGLLLLIACANVANLLLAKATAREKELAIRGSLGASKWQIVRLLLTESMVLALAGAAFGVFLAWAELRLLLAILPPDTFPLEAQISLNGPVLFGAVVLAAFTATLFGLAPAIGVFASNLSEPLKAGGRGNSGFRRGRLRNLLIIAEVALSLILLTAAGLMMRSFLLMSKADLGFQPERIVITQIQLSGKSYKTAEKRALFGKELTTRLRTLPGVLDATATLDTPPSGGMDTSFELPGKTRIQTLNGQMAFCDSQFFRTIGMRLLRGRLLTPADIASKRKVAVVNQELAQSFFPGENPIGKPIKLLGLERGPEPVPDPTFEIVGVVSNVRNNSLRQATLPETYSPLTLSPYGFYAVFIRTAGNPATLSKALDGAVLALDRNVLPQYTMTMEGWINRFELAQPRFELEMFAVFALVGLLLVSVGVYSVVAYTVSQQTREIGIRMALGGTRADIRNWVLKSGMRFILIGICCGFFIALVLLKLLKSEIAGINASDPITLSVVIALLALVGLLACCVPALRATRIDPAIALRQE